MSARFARYGYDTRVSLHPGDHLISTIPFIPSLVEVEMSDLEGNFDAIILGTGLVESIAAAYVMQSCPM